MADKEDSGHRLTDIATKAALIETTEENCDRAIEALTYTTSDTYANTSHTVSFRITGFGRP